MRTEHRAKKGFIRRWTGRLFKTAIVLVVITLPAAYFLIPKIASTGWAKARFEKIMSSATGGPVNVDTFKVGWSNGITTTGVRSETVRKGDWDIDYVAKEITLKPKVKDLFGRAVLMSADIVEPVIHLQQRTPVAAPAVVATSCVHTKYRFVNELKLNSLSVRNGSVTWDSDIFNSPVVLENFDLDINVRVGEKNLEVTIDKCTGTLNGGAVSLKGSINDKSTLQLTGTNISANDLLAQVLKQLTPMFETTAPGTVSGTFDINLRAEGAGTKLEGAGEIVFAGNLSRIRFIEAIATEAGLPVQSVSMKEVVARLRFADGRIHNVGTVASNMDGAVRLTGWSERGACDFLAYFDGRPLATPGGQLEEILHEACENGGVRILGTLAQPQVRLSN